MPPPNRSGREVWSGYSTISELEEGMENRGWSELSIGKKIHLYRMHANLNIDKLARLSGVSPSYISKVESNKSIPSIDVLENLSSALATTASKILAYPPFSPSSPADESAAVQRRQNLLPMVVRKNERKKIRPPKTNVDYELLTPDLQRDLEFVMVVHPRRSRRNLTVTWERKACCVCPGP